MGNCLKTSNGGISFIQNGEIKQSSESNVLNQNYPNPFNPQTTISFVLGSSQHIELKIFDIMGNELTTLVNGFKEEGEHKIIYDASALSSGIYFYRVVGENFSITKKLMLLK